MRRVAWHRLRRCSRVNPLLRGGARQETNPAQAMRRKCRSGFTREAGNATPEAPMTGARVKGQPAYRPQGEMGSLAG
ncbi:hypothetical protein J3A98_002202 [Pseudomonas sp. BP6]|nr:hypothetical protein [Pseudomonas sp. BP6]MBP2289520.1 hypothetical protein [Pseudomonas sp. BP7]